MYKKIISFILVICLISSSLSTFCFASNTELNESSLRLIYESLSEEAKVIFNEQIKSDPVLLSVHQKYVGDLSVQNDDITYSDSKLNTLLAPDNLESLRMASATGTLDVLQRDLQSLRLSAPLYYALMGEASSLVAAGADGPFPIGDIAGAIVAALSTVVVITYAQEFIEKYPGIKQAFTKAFNSTANEISKGFDEVYRKCVDWVSGSASANTITIDGISYVCDTKAEEVSQEMKRKQILYYPAILKNNAVWVATTPIDRTIALKIMRLNDDKIGVFAMSSSRAAGLCGGLGSIRGPENHGSGEGYWSHYHGSQAPNAHCWFVD